jgi:NADPH-dependent curcumin reductase CurA
VRNHFLSLDPYMRGRMNDVKSYAAPVNLGDVMIGGTAGEVVASKHPKFAVGDKVVGMLGWQLYGVSDGTQLMKVDDRHIPLSAYLGTVGMPGVTAWYGLMDICAPKAGETVVVTAASGAVGSVVGQLAKMKGCRAVGIAGGAEKCRYVVDELGFDACVDYKAGNSVEGHQGGDAERHRLPVRERRRRDLRHPARAHERLLAHRPVRPHLPVQRGAVRHEEHRPPTSRASAAS